MLCVDFYGHEHAFEHATFIFGPATLGQVIRVDIHDVMLYLTFYFVICVVVRFDHLLKIYELELVHVGRLHSLILF